ncbi:MAG: AraC family transcriptional regulator ligand-binding domain-containing protein, partial [Myxococcales bacterium]|nr:AraC family transcriptional regulator ligand-binding domain-containing protein [Myxococcales bacterium]
RCAARLDIEAYGVFGLAVRSSATVRECVDIANECLCLLHDASRIRLVEEGDVSRLVYELVGTERRMHLHSAALMVAATVELLRRLIVSRWSPIAIYFEGPAPADASPYETQLGAPVHFGASEHAIAFATETLGQALLSGDRSLSAMYRARVSAILESRRKQLSDSDETQLVARARDAIGAALGGGEPSLEEIARSLALSGRTLQRRLRGAGTTFQLLLDRTRQEMALSLLKSGVPVEDVPPLIGYADVNAYRRAFKRWTSQAAR